MENYYYELKMINGEASTIHKFPADITSWDMTLRLKDFLLGCSWGMGSIRNILNLEGTEYEESN